MADISNLSNYLKDVADAIREKKGTEEQIPAANFDTEILNIQTGADVSGVTAVASDVKVNKKFVDSTGELKSGTFPDISYNSTSAMSSYELVASNFKHYTESQDYYKTSYLTKGFRGFIYEAFNEKLVIKDSVDTLQSIELGEAPWVLSVGCKDVYNENTVLIALTYNDRVDFYSYNYVDNNINLSSTIVASDYDIPADSQGRYTPVCCLSPVSDLISISWGFYNNTNLSYCWICKLKPDFTFDKLQQVYGTTSSNRGSYLSSVYWVSNDIIVKCSGAFYNLFGSDVYLNLDTVSKQLLYNDGMSIASVDSTIESIDENQEYCIIRSSSSSEEYLLKKLNISAPDIVIGDTIKTFTITDISSTSAVIQDDLIVIADYVDNSYTSKFYTLDRSTDVVTEINELIPNCNPDTTLGDKKYLDYKSKKYFYILTTTIDNITSMEYEGKTFIDTSDANATSNDIVKDKTAYVNGEKIIGTYEEVMSLDEYAECLELSQQILGENVSL